jgi:hypothetical protein
MAYIAALGYQESECLESAGMTAGGTTRRLVGPSAIVAEIAGRKIALSPVFSEGLPIILLGRQDFFSVFKIVIDEKKQRFSLHPY